MLAILDRYLMREIAVSTFGVVVVLLVILLGNTTVHILGKIAEGALPEDALLPMVVINMVHYLTILLPLSLYLGILLAMGRLYRDSEMTALYACGISVKRLYRPLSALAVTTALLSALLALYLAPKVSAARQLIKHQVEQRSELAGITAGRFNVSKNGDGMMFVERLTENRDHMINVFLSLRPRNPEMERMIESSREAQNIFISEKQKPYMVYRAGYLYALPKESLAVRITEFEEHGVEIQEKNPAAVHFKISATPTRELWLAGDGVSLAEIHWRLALPLACLLLAGLALPLSHTTPRKGRYAKLAVGILIYLIYTNLLGIGRALIEKELLPPMLGINLVHAGLLLLIGILLWKRSGFMKLRFSTGNK